MNGGGIGTSGVVKKDAATVKGASLWKGSPEIPSARDVTNSQPRRYTMPPHGGNIPRIALNGQWVSVQHVIDRR
jgi:hypothetical protein